MRQHFLFIYQCLFCFFCICYFLTTLHLLDKSYQLKIFEVESAVYGEGGILPADFLRNNDIEVIWKRSIASSSLVFR